MVELCCRIVIALAILIAGVLGQGLDLQMGLGLGLGLAAYSGLVYWIEIAEKRNGGIAGFMAVIDSMFIATALSQIGVLDRYGFLVLVPMMWATGRFGSDAASMSPLVAASVMVASNFFENEGFTLPILLHTAGILLVGLMTNQAKVVLKETQVEVPVTKEVMVPNTGDERVRGEFKTLKDQVRDLEKKGRRDRVAMSVLTASQQSDDPFFAILADKVKGASEVSGVIVYQFDHATKRMIVRDSVGKVAADVRDLALDVPTGLGDGQIRHQIDRRLSALRAGDQLVHCGSILLKDRGKIVGMVALFDSKAANLDFGVRTIADAADALGPLVASARQKEEFERRLRETEILYSVASVGLGAETKQSLVARVVREIGSTIRLDHVGVFFVDGDEAIQVASAGAVNRLFEDISFGYGQGVEGWLKMGGPEIVCDDTLADDRIDKTTALKRRVGSYVMIPLWVAGEVFGFISASTHSVGGVDQGKMLTLRAIGAELSQALGRLEYPSRDPEGVMTPKEFFGTIRSGKRGHLVYLEILKREEVIERYGSPAYGLAVRKLLTRLRSQLPTGGGICRREEGDYVVYLPTTEEAVARRWANETTASASFVGISTPDGRSKMPLALRAKVAVLSPQKNQVSAEKTA